MLSLLNLTIHMDKKVDGGKDPAAVHAAFGAAVTFSASSSMRSMLMP